MGLCYFPRLGPKKVRIKIDKTWIGKDLGRVEECGQKLGFERLGGSVVDHVDGKVSGSGSDENDACRLVDEHGEIGLECFAGGGGIGIWRWHHLQFCFGKKSRAVEKTGDEKKEVEEEQWDGKEFVLQ